MHDYFGTRIFYEIKSDVGIVAYISGIGIVANISGIGIVGSISGIGIGIGIVVSWILLS